MSKNLKKFALLGMASGLVLSVQNQANAEVANVDEGKNEITLASSCGAGSCGAGAAGSKATASRGSAQRYTADNSDSPYMRHQQQQPQPSSVSQSGCPAYKKNQTAWNEGGCGGRSANTRGYYTSDRGYNGDYYGGYSGCSSASSGGSSGCASSSGFSNQGQYVQGQNPQQYSQYSQTQYTQSQPSNQGQTQGQYTQQGQYQPTQGAQQAYSDQPQPSSTGTATNSKLKK